MNVGEFIRRFNDELVRLGYDELLEAHRPPLGPAARYQARTMFNGWLHGVEPEVAAKELYDGFILVKNKLFTIQ